MRCLVDNYAAHPPIRELLLDLAHASLGSDGDEGSLSTIERAARSTRSMKVRVLFEAWLAPSMRCRNSLTADHSRVGSGLLKSNLHLLPLGCGSATNAITYYQNKYTAKSDF